VTPAVLVTGGTGTLGRRVIPRLVDAGCAVRVLSRTVHEPEAGVEYVRGDLAKDEGLGPATRDIDIVIHLAGTAKGDDIKTRRLLEAASEAGVKHFVYISVVGADSIPVRSAIDRGMFGYYAAKLASERLIESSGIPFTILRATQFQESMLAVVKGLAGMVIIPAPTGSRFQPIATDEVAERLVELALGEPAGMVDEMGGPKAYLLADLVRSYLAATGRHKSFISMRAPGKAAAALRDGANLTLDHAVGRRTWEEFLAREVR
jgi:uncharacterized protein YbjT (DUF2867 family)